MKKVGLAGILSVAMVFNFTAVLIAPVTAHADPVNTTSSSTCLISTPSIGSTTTIGLPNFGQSSESTLQTVLNTQVSGIDAANGQKNYQYFHTADATTTVSIQLVGSYTGNGDVFGYYQKGHPETFVPLIKGGVLTNATYPNMATTTAGSTFTVTLPAGDWAFGINTDTPDPATQAFFSTDSSANPVPGYIMAVSYSDPAQSNSYYIAFEDWSNVASDFDHNDMVVKISVSGCTNPPVIPPAPTTGTLTVCKMIIDQNGVIATSSAGLALGYFGLTVGTSTDIFGNPLFQDQFATNTFAPNTDLTLSHQNDSQCVTHTESLGTYYYSQEDIAGNFPVWTKYPVRYFGGLQQNFSVATSTQYDTVTLPKDSVTLTNDHPDQTIVMINGYQSATVTPPPPSTCVVPDQLSNTSKVSIGSSPETTTATILSSNGINLNTYTDQKNYQVWHLSSSATVSVKFLDGITADADVFGYYHVGHPETFVPLLADGGSISLQYPTATSTAGQIASVTLPAGDWAFGLSSQYSSSTPHYLWASEKSLNAGDTHVLSYDVSSTSYAVAVEDTPTAQADNDFNDFVGLVTVNCSSVVPNTPPTITLVGSNPLVITQGTTFTDPGATAHDAEDGDLTSHIVVTGGPVDTTHVGTTTLVYSVTDSGGLTASTTRIVIVNPAGGGGCTSDCGGGGGPSAGTISVCFVIANANGVIATSSNNLPAGLFSLTLATTSNASTTLGTAHFDASAFAPNRMLITTSNDSQCQSFTNLPFGNYIYSQLATTSPTSAAWTTAKYNDQFDTPVSSLMTFFNYSSTSPDADGSVVLNSMNTEQTIVVLEQYTPATTTIVNTPPVITLIGDNPLTLTVGATFTDPGATAHDAEDGDITSKIIATSTVSTTTPGTYTIVYSVTDSGGLTANTTRTVIVSNPSGGGGCTSDCGGGGGGTGSGCTSNCGGGGGGNGPIAGSLPPATNGGGSGSVTTSSAGGSNGGTCYYLYDYLHTGWNNNPVEVKKLQVFLKDLEGYNVDVTGIYDDQTVVALDVFQVKYADDILVPWDGTHNPSGFTYILTKKKVNEIYCQTAFPLTAQQQSVIDAYRQFISDLNSNGVNITAPTPAQVQELNNEPSSTSTASTVNGIGLGNGNGSFLAIGGPSSTTTVGALRDAAAAILGFPWNWMKGIFDPNQCVFNNPAYCKSIDWILGALVLMLIILGFRSGKKKNTDIQK